jgi:hypothetical protein
MRTGRNVDFPTCPQCGAVVKRPEEVGGQLPGGSCVCGTVYVMDPTGLNMGEALLEALSLACGGNPDLGWNLQPGEDYQDYAVLGYDPARHVIVGSATTFRSGMAALLFISLKEGGLERARERART